jgi:hypothetical protein
MLWLKHHKCWSTFSRLLSLTPHPKWSSLELLFSPSPPDSKEELTRVSRARSLVDCPFMLLAHSTLCYLYVSSLPFFSLLDSFSKKMDLWVPLGIAHLCGSFESATQNIWIVSNTSVSLGFHSICHNWWHAFLFLLACWYIDILKILLELIHYSTALSPSWVNGVSIPSWKEVQVLIALGARLLKGQFPYE